MILRVNPPAAYYEEAQYPRADGILGCGRGRLHAQ